MNKKGGRDQGRDRGRKREREGEGEMEKEERGNLDKVDSNPQWEESQDTLLLM